MMAVAVQGVDMSYPDPAYIAVIIILVLGILGGYYLYRNALRHASEMDDMDGTDANDEDGKGHGRA